MRTRPPAWQAVALTGLMLALLAGCEPQALPAGRGVQGEAKPLQHASPVVVEVCGQSQTYAAVPQRAITHDVNITEMFLFLGLGEKLVGYSGISSKKEIAPDFEAALDRLPNLSSQEMNLEAMVAARADFVFAGWSYGFVSGGVTPELLASHGIASYVLSESCIRVRPRPRVALEDVEQDLQNVARIFGVQQQAQGRIAQLRQARERLARQMQGNTATPRVFVFDSGEKIPMTAGRLGMPQAILTAAGARNIFDDIPSNWPLGNWEDMLARDPEWIVIVDYGLPSAQGKIDLLLSKPELAQVSAIRNRRFFVMRYAEATPGPRSVQAAQRLAAALHPQRQITQDAVLMPAATSAGERP